MLESRPPHLGGDRRRHPSCLRAQAHGHPPAASLNASGVPIGDPTIRATQTRLWGSTDLVHFRRFGRSAQTCRGPDCCASPYLMRLRHACVKRNLGRALPSRACRHTMRQSSSSEAFHMPTDKLRLAVIGVGSWANRVQIPQIISHPAAELVALCARTEDKLRRAGEDFGVTGLYTTTASSSPTSPSMPSPSAPPTMPTTRSPRPPRSRPARLL